MPFRKIALILAVVLSAFAARAAESAPSGLKNAWVDVHAVRSVFFIEGMSCRACAMMLHRKINGSKGVYWARFNFPLRLLTLYHSPQSFPASNVTGAMDGSSELKATLIAQKPASVFKPGKTAKLASWNGARVDSSEKEPILKPFASYLTAEMGESDERTQVYYEILGENARNRLLWSMAMKEGVEDLPSIKEFPRPVMKDFYWQENTAPTTPTDRAVAAYVSKMTSGSSPKDEMKQFEDLLKRIYAETAFEFTGEYAEDQVGVRP